ncbi:MAG: hypothetical protein KGS61_13840 [Verrucomicrobia bacterium]|nr:hypothetical protein [Verrucomicrobiota bacterium]
MAVGNDDGHRPPVTPATGQWQFGPDGGVPPRAFEMHARERERFHLMARSLPLDPDPTAEVEKLGGVIFDATYGGKVSDFSKQIDAGQLEVERLTTDRSRLASELASIPATVEKETAEPAWPRRFSVKWWELVAFLAVFCVSSAGAVGNIVTLLLPSCQSMLAALLMAFVWVGLSVAAKRGTGCLPGRLRPLAYAAVTLVGCVGGILWLTGITISYGGGVNLNHLVDSGILTPSKTLPFVGQLLAEFAVGVACLGGAVAMLSFERHTEVNPDRKVVSTEIGAVDRDLGEVLALVGKAEGNLAELRASRAAFAAEGVAVVRAREARERRIAENTRLIAENDQLIDRLGQ